MSRPDPIPGPMLVIGHQWPEPDATAAGQRMLWLLRGFQNAGYEITFACGAGAGTYEVDLESLGIEKVGIRLNDSSFDRFLESRGFSLVLFDRFLTEEQFSWRVRKRLPEALLVLDTEDLHSLRHSREQTLKNQRPWKTTDWVQDPLFYREVASMFRADLSLIVSSFEMQLLAGQVPFLEPKLLYLPFGMEPGPEDGGPGFEARSDFVFMGNGKHRPNLDAIAQLKSEIWPLLRNRLPEARLLVYGAYLPGQILGLHNPSEGFLVRGWAPDMQSVFGSARLQLAPLRFGAGIKGKVLSAAGFGLPTAGTACAFEGIVEASDQCAYTAETPEDFTRKAITLYQDPYCWKKALDEQQRAAKAHLEVPFDVLERALDSLRKGEDTLPGETRIIENLLRSEAFGRLQYLSRWIEAKEKAGH